ncbi:thioredoxin domain-containing protein [Actinomarinicola tropica]|uniref:Thioredoxin domain-containing protein n=1 Tax=Actinomarinicola tropica TaxID=2789776 RepID=A0A5Q2RPK8_9ACTN|nr:hypothetical protein [Actinomarinicola tropica]QGG95810.1 hypothetical protein GH723_12265 [Actinomarinicola tropica]
MERLLLAVVLVAVAGVIAWFIQRRQPDVPSSPPEYSVPTQLDRADFTRPEAPWLVAVFTSATCDVCRGTWEKAQILESDDVAVQEIEVAAEPELHRRYQIDGVPLVVIADAEGTVRNGFVGPPTATDLWATVAEIRDPGSVPPGCDHGQPVDPTS